ncbi:MAG TPA: hypothetical protein VFT29_13730 [Gemmatimonadaceae bacterium]|nr:hypothetical protein [Gemmatimonadaceae bacterium]
MKPYAATATVVPCESREEAEATSEAVRAHGADVLIARRPRWYVKALPEDVRRADWCIVVILAEEPRA